MKLREIIQSLYMDTNESLHLYHLTLKKQTNYIHSCIGHFVNFKPHHLNLLQKTETKKRKKRELQLCLATETHIELYDLEEGTFEFVTSVQIFSSILCMDKLFMNDSTYLVLVTDSGNLTICEFYIDSKRVKLKTLFNEPFSRSGIRRLSPQAHLQVDILGRCIFLSALEKNKICYLTDKKVDQINISSPLEASKFNYITIQTVACDVGYDNPCFASLEIDLSDKCYYLNFYILDLGLNNIVRGSEYLIDDKSVNFILSIPNLEPYGIRTKKYMDSQYSRYNDDINCFVLCGFDNYLSLRDLHGYYNLSVQIPTREGQSNTCITSGTFHKLKNDFFVLLQSNYGDLYKLKILPNFVENNEPVMNIIYFDTIPQAESIHILRNGYMFSNSEIGNNYLYQFESLGEENNTDKILTSYQPGKRLLFEPFSKLQNLSIADQMVNLNPIISSQVTEATPLNLLIKSRYKVKYLTTGIKFQDLISSPLPSVPSGIWTIKFPCDKYHRLIFMSILDNTTILEITDGTVEEIELKNDIFILSGDKTLFVGTMGNSSIIQVCQNLMTQVSYHNDKYESRIHWYPPAGVKIIGACCTRSQLVLSLSNKEIVYFEIELNDYKDSLNELQSHIELDSKILSVSMVSSAFRSDMLVVASQDSSVKVFSLKKNDKEHFLEVMSMQVLMSPASSLQLIEVNSEIHLHIGLISGIYIRSKISKHDYQLFDIRNKYLGNKSIYISVLPSVVPYIREEYEEDKEVVEVDIEQGHEIPCAIIYSNKTWISYDLDSCMFIQPLRISGNENFKTGADFKTSEIATNGLCSITSSGSLIIGKIEQLSTRRQWFNMKNIIPLSEKEGDGESDEEITKFDEDDKNFTGRKIITDLDDPKLCYNIENHCTEKFFRISIIKNGIIYTLEPNGSYYAIVNDSIYLAATIAKFNKDTRYLCISTTDGLIKTFEIRYLKSPSELTFQVIYLHETKIVDTVYDMIAFGDKLLVPIYNSLVLYGLGKKQLLKKSITKTLPSITKIVALDRWKSERIAIGDIKESVILYQFRNDTNQFIQVADDITKRHVTVIKFIDECSIIGGDKFGNIWVLRLDQKYDRIVREEFHEFLTMVDNKNKNIPNIMECPFKLTLLNHFYLNDIPTSFNIVPMVQMSDRTSIIYTGLQGSVGSLVPLMTNREVLFFQKLEKILGEADYRFYLNIEKQAQKDEDNQDSNDLQFNKINKLKHNNNPEGSYSIVGRDHRTYRGYYSPIKHVIDGDLCELFLLLYPSEQEFLANQIGKYTSQEIKKYINELHLNCM